MIHVCGQNAYKHNYMAIIQNLKLRHRSDADVARHICYIIIGLTLIYKTARETSRTFCITNVMDTLHEASTQVYIAEIAQMR